MDSERLRETLEELHLDLLQFSTTEKPLQEKRDKLAAQIRKALDQDSLKESHLDLKELIDEQIVSFEANPKTSQIMRSIIEILGSIGI